MINKFPLRNITGLSTMMISSLDKLPECENCHKQGYYCNSGHDVRTCPLCGYYKNGDYPAFPDENGNYPDDPDEDYPLGCGLDKGDFEFCNYCKCIYDDFGCTHAVQGCDFDIFNGHIISRWKDKSTDTIYDGMPQFRNKKQWNDRAKDVEILAMVCPNNGIRCPNAYHKDSKNYMKCKLTPI